MVTSNLAFFGVARGTGRVQPSRSHFVSCQSRRATGRQLDVRAFGVVPRNPDNFARVYPKFGGRLTCQPCSAGRTMEGEPGGCWLHPPGPEHATLWWRIDMSLAHDTPIRGVAYFRMSGDRQEASIPDQQAWVRQACPRENVEVVREF